VVVNRTQALPVGFAVLAVAGLVVILAVAPPGYERALRLPDGHRGLVEVALLVALAGVLAVLGVGALLRWRWLFWLVLAAFAAGALRIPVAAAQLTGHLRSADPTWYALMQAIAGTVQVVIASVMLADYRRHGVWGAPTPPPAGQTGHSRQHPPP
jgi:hypothetical protein